MEYRIDKQGLLERIGIWDGYLRKQVRLIACGGTALTLLEVKASTKDIDLIVPDVKEYDYLIDIIKQLGYESASGWGWRKEDNFIFDLFKGKTIHTTELLESPLEKKNHFLVEEFNHIYLGVLNYYDIIISKLFRSTAIDIDDCLILIKSKQNEINLEYLKERFYETASCDVSEDKVNKNFEHFLNILRKRELGNGK